MKRFLVVLMVVMAPVLLMAQPMQMVTAYLENFDGDNITMSTPTSPNGLGGTLGDWRVVGSGITYSNWNCLELYNSSPKSWHSPVYSTAGSSNSNTEPIPLTTPGFNLAYIYLDFDHICKVSALDMAQIYYSVAQGFDEDGNLNWGQWKLLNFSSNSPFYYGDAKSNSATAITSGKFSDNTYPNWSPNPPQHQPNNTWWHHEMIDISSMILTEGTNPTHFRIQFRLNKTSPSESGTDAYAGWYVDNLTVRFSNCELIRPAITMQAPFYYAENPSFVNNVGPYNIKAKLFDNDTIAVDKVRFYYELNNNPTDTIPNTNAFTSNVLNASGHTIQAQWLLPTICYQDTIRYHIYLEDTHGSSTRFDTFLIAHHNQTNIHYNDVQVDTLNEHAMPHCLITGSPQEVIVYFKNRSDAAHSPGTPTMTSGTFALEVRDENGVLFHNSTSNWTGDICFDVPSSLSLGTFTPHKGYNYITVYVVTRNGQEDGFHNNDTVTLSPFACDSLLRGDYTVGGTNPDFADMEAVKLALDFCGMAGPVVFHLRPGTYEDFDFTQNYLGQSAVNTITFQGDNVNSVIVVNNQTDAGANVFGAVTLVNVKNYIFKNLTIQGNNSSTASRGVVVRGNGSANILFEGCKITAHNTHSTATTSCAVSRTAAATSIPDTVTFRNCTIIGGNFGIHYVGANNKKNLVTIEGCDITSCYRGIYTNYTNGAIKNNHIKQVPSSTPQAFSGIYSNYVVGADIDGNTVDSVSNLEYAIYLGNATAENFYVRNNHVKTGHGTAGIYLTNSSSSNTVTGYLYNNEVILYPVTAANSYAVQINNSNNLYLINNSILAKSDAPFNNTAALYISNNNNTYIYNNILLNQVVTNDNSGYPIYLNGNSRATGSYNDFYSNSGVIAYKTVPRNTINEFESADTSVHNSISVLPPIADATESLLPLSFTGLECWRSANVLQDIRNQSRSEVTYMGAYADQIPSIDAALTALISPALGECPQTAYDIIVEITNKGAQTINFANNPAVVNIQSVALNLNQNVNVNSGSVTALNKINQLLTQNVAIPVNQAVDFKITITTNGDHNHANDTMVRTFILEAIAPDYSEDFSNGTKQVWTIEQISGAGNWTCQNGTGTQPTITPVYGIGRLFFNSKNFSNSTVSRAILPVVMLNNTTHPILEIWFAHDNASNKPNEGVTVKISTDGGNTYTSMIPEEHQSDPNPVALIKRYKQTATVPMWQLYTFDLSNYVSYGCVYIAFDAAAQGGNNINIDRIRVRNLYDNDIAVSKIYGSGETPAQYSIKGVVSALVKNEGAQAQNNIPVYLTVTGATEQWQDTLIVPTLPYHGETLITFPDHEYNVEEVKDVEVRAADDQHNINNAEHWRMVATHNVANYADTTTDIVLVGDYNNVIRPCVRYKTNEDLAVVAVKYYYDQTYIADPDNGFRAFVSDASGNVLATSDVISFSDLQQQQWNTIPIQNFALTTTTGEFYVGLEMLAHGNYLCAQVETPLRDSTFYYLNNGVYEPQLSGRFMIGAVVDTPYVHDLALLSLTHPVTNCDLGHEHINVLITNNGTTDILPPIRLQYTINGGATVSEDFTDTLHSHEITTFAFNSIYDFTNNQVNVDDNYQIRVWATKLIQDRLTYNDTLGVTVISKGKSPVPTAPDTVIVNYHTSATLSAQLPASIPQGVIGWYTNSGYENWNLLGYGPTYTTPIIYFDTLYYATANPGTVDDFIVGTGNASGTDPFTFTNGYSRGRILYTEQEIGSHGTITTFAFNVKTAASADGSAGIPIKIYMKCVEEGFFNSTNVDWNAELVGATLVVDDRIFFDHAGWYYFTMETPFDFNTGNLVIYTETNCADYCMGTGSQCNNCGAYVSGSTGYPSFYMTATSATQCQKKAANTLAQMSGAYTNVARKLNARFTVANLECGSAKVPIQIHVPDIPDYDVETQALLYPTSGCPLYNEHIQVQLKNMLNTPIPANKVVIHAIFNGTEITHTVADAFASEEVKVVEFSTPFDFSAPTANITFNYTIFTTLNNEAIVYTGNDTIHGSLTSNKTAYMPDSIVYTGNYTQRYTILEPEDRPNDINQYYFYSEDSTLVHTSTTSAQYYQTNPLYDTAIFYVRGRTVNSSCTTKYVKVIINVFHPQYDLSTDEFIYPVSYQCANSLSPNLKVSVTNQDTTASSVIPSGTFNLNAHFTGSANVDGVNLITTPISSLVQDTITFANGMNLGSTTQNRIYQYVVYTTSADHNMPVYTLNDTIRGSMYFPALPVAPQALSYTVPYGGTQTVTPSGSALNYYYFYDSSEGGEAIAEGNSFTTDPIYSPTTYYYSGRIESTGFNNQLIISDGNVTNQTNAPFTLTNGHSYAKILYNKQNMEGKEGRIDSLFFYVCTADNNGVPIPMKFWLKNTADAQAISNASAQVNWPTETADATLVFDGELVLDHVGWVGFPVSGGFDYTGEGLLLYCEHNCGSSSCVVTYGISPTPKFTNERMPDNAKKMLTKAQNTELTSQTSFSLSNYRVKTRFSMNYTCESPRSTITVNTTVPQHDVGVVNITAPVTQSNDFTNSETVTVTLENFGTSAASNFPVSYQLGNNTPVTQNYTGSLAAGATADFTFSTNCDLTSVYLATPFKAYTSLATDTYHSNDTTQITLSVENPCPSRPLSSDQGAHITNVSFAALNNGVGAPYLNHPTAPGNGMYSDFTQTVAPVEVILGQEYTLSVTHAFTATTTKTVFKRAWIDYNRNGMFDSNEEIFATGPVLAGDSNAISSAYVNIPTNADLGLTRMRVICAATNQTDPCSFYNADGETEDYAVLLSAPMEIDLGVPAILHPVGDICPDDNAIMRVNIRNYGTETQTLSMNNPATLTITVTGAVPATYTKVVESGTLAPNSEMTIPITNVDFSAQGTYNVSVALTYPADQYMTNNTRASVAEVTSTTVIQLPLVEPFDAQGTDIHNPQLSSDWTRFTLPETPNPNYYWNEYTGAAGGSANNGNGCGPAHDHTNANLFGQEEFGGFVSVAGVNSRVNENKWTYLTSGCVNMHYNDIYPAELYFYKYFASNNVNADFDMYIQIGSGEYYQDVDHLKKEDGGQVGNDDQWSLHALVLHNVDEVARLRFAVTGQKFRIDPSIDDINLIIGLPDLAMTRVVYPVDKSLTTECLHINSVVVPIVEIYNNGNSAVQEFDVQFQVGVGDDITTTTEHVVHFMNPGDTLQYTSTNEFVVTNLSSNWEVRATVIIPNDKDNYNNTKRSLSCTDVGIPDYENEDDVYLGQNEPNPAVANTRVPYYVPEADKVTFDITTTSGQVIYTVSQEAEQGINYLDLSTANLAVGVYYYTLHYKDIVLTKKMIVKK